MMKFDSDDVRAMIADGSMLPVVTHEMIHVLGFGTLWPTRASNCANSCLIYDANAAGRCYASEQYAAMGLPGSLLVESQGQPQDGTYCSHWSEDQLGAELMSGLFDPAVPYNPLTAITIGGLQDAGYSVDYAQAEPLAEPARSRQLREARLAAADKALLRAPRTVRRLNRDVIRTIPVGYSEAHEWGLRQQGAK
ncbi:hypothetical protein JKP88DRAFT_260447 [Tribonema minus]|uniref:Leishmanolysin n=1 Tax=Tribonema minus TaxID=303371 RepID=A0A836CH80_9STRA|nr:hypothetical protein JKP88DRAFT_260447 [Tribonema minus]